MPLHRPHSRLILFHRPLLNDRSGEEFAQRWQALDEGGGGHTRLILIFRIQSRNNVFVVVPIDELPINRFRFQLSTERFPIGLRPIVSVNIGLHFVLKVFVTFEERFRFLLGFGRNVDRCAYTLFFSYEKRRPSLQAQHCYSVLFGFP
jgi:hypothetical protein